ncbi:YfcE family phosphodiesterase [Sediminibacillus dalangtanensis]|uniref:Phosphoesterase n=1 Tax=Sediminibacillus dalangtanensis TaxID=2729421 RepID=A0ABX7VSR7_9BACI|nr:metallophosphoesterase [Sediminibacillus dalangtanensis]QTM99994.1 YfcE family phosphodiesterase [Sediminibacillus dalangtanensis]
MPKVLIMSDSHGWTEEVAVIRDRHKEEVDQFIHCGDSELDADAPELEQFMKVAGNCDMDSRFPDESHFSVGSLHFYVAHGHLHQVKSTLMPLSYRAEEVGAQVICFGHTHIAGAERVDNQLFINPGSIRLPRGRSEHTYAILSWEDKGEITVEFKDWNGKTIEEMMYRTSLD